MGRLVPVQSVHGIEITHDGSDGLNPGKQAEGAPTPSSLGQVLSKQSTGEVQPEVK